MAIYHLLYRTSVAGRVPSAANMPAGRLGLNLVDERIYFANEAGTVVEPQPRAHTHTISEITNLASATALTSQDLNSVTAAGPYYQNSDAGATSALNYPITLAGVLEVVAVSGGNLQIMQRYTTRSGSGLIPRVFVRNRFTTSLTWYPWVELGVASVATTGATAITLSVTQAGVITRTTSAAAVTVTVNADIGIVGTEYHFRQAAAGAITFTAGSGVTINPPFSGTLVTPGSGATVTLKCVATNVYDLVGQVLAA